MTSAPFTPAQATPAANLDTTVSRFASLPGIETHALTVSEAAGTTGWSSRMLRYIERFGLIEPHRTDAGYRLYGPAELQRLRTLKELLDANGMSLSDLAFAARLRTDDRARAATDAWLEAEAERPEHVPAADWLRWEQDKHERLLRRELEPA